MLHQNSTHGTQLYILLNIGLRHWLMKDFNDTILAGHLNSCLAKIIGGPRYGRMFGIALRGAQVT